MQASLYLLDRFEVKMDPIGLQGTCPDPLTSFRMDEELEVRFPVELQCDDLSLKVCWRCWTCEMELKQS